MSKKKKNPAAVSLAALRWKDTTPEERSELMSKAAKANVAKRQLEPEKFSADMSKAGKAGGPARAKALTSKQRSEIASAAAKARWAKKREEDGLAE